MSLFLFYLQQKKFFRLNEGHTVYLERHICGRLFGEKFRHFHALGGWGELQNSVSRDVKSIHPRLYRHSSIVCKLTLLGSNKKAIFTGVENQADLV